MRLLYAVIATFLTPIVYETMVRSGYLISINGEPFPLPEIVLAFWASSHLSYLMTQDLFNDSISNRR